GRSRRRCRARWWGSSGLLGWVVAGDGFVAVGVEPPAGVVAGGARLPVDDPQVPFGTGAGGGLDAGERVAVPVGRRQVDGCRIGLAGVGLVAVGRRVAGWCGGECRVGGLEVVGELLGGAVGVLAEPGVGPGGVVAGLALADGVAVPFGVVP